MTRLRLIAIALVIAASTLVSSPASATLDRDPQSLAKEVRG